MASESSAVNRGSLGAARSSAGLNPSFPGAVPFLERAIQLDPDFGMAYVQLGYAYQSIGETVKGAENIRKAFELRGRMTELEKLIVEGDYYSETITGL